MANVIIPNFDLVSSSNTFNSVWKLTRAMKKAGWIYKSSGNGPQKETTGSSVADLWGGNVDPNTDTYSAMGTTTTGGSQSLPPAGGILNVASTTSFPTSGAILVATSANGWQTVSYTGTTATSFTGCTGGTGTAPITSPVGGSAINMDGYLAWWNAQGPSTLKIPISTAQTTGSLGNFIRGENISQAVTQAQGELLGYLFDPTPASGGAGTGYLVVMPRVDGYGADPHGWDHSHVITGSISGATITPSSTAIEFVREVVFWKQNTVSSGAVYYQCVDGYISETTSRFSSLATSAGCNGFTAPGGGGTNNGFPVPGSIVIAGTGGATTFDNWFHGASNPTNLGRALFIATSASYAANTSADGSFTIAVGYPPSGSSGAFIGFMFTRVDSQEDGDIDPYVWYAPVNSTVYTVSRTSVVSSFAGATNNYWDPNAAGNTVNFFQFWRRRGRFDAVDAFQNGTVGLTTVINAGLAVSQTLTDREKVANTFNDIYSLEDVWCVSTNIFQKTRKGICRWLKAVQGGNGCDLYGNRTWLQLAHAGGAGYGLVVGPWDGSTIQTQA